MGVRQATRQAITKASATAFKGSAKGSATAFKKSNFAKKFKLRQTAPMASPVVEGVFGTVGPYCPSHPSRES